MTKPILTITFHQPATFRYFWIKYVRGFDPNVHCAKCLVGNFSKLLKYRELANLTRVSLDEHSAPFIYVCGVTSRWEWNVHVAGHLENGHRTEYSDERVSILVENFRHIEIVADGNPTAPKEFSTCRNWQFGWTAFPNTRKQLEFPE